MWVRALSQAKGLFFSSRRLEGNAAMMRAHTRITCAAWASMEALQYAGTRASLERV